MSKDGNKLVLKFGLDTKVSEAVATLFIALLVEEMEFGPRNKETHQREKGGWGIGTALVTKVVNAEGAWTEPRSDIRVRFEFNAAISRGQADTFWGLVHEEVAHSVWGIGPARVLSVGTLGFGK